VERSWLDDFGETYEFEEEFVFAGVLGTERAFENIFIEETPPLT